MVGKKQSICISLDFTSRLLKGNKDKGFRDNLKVFSMSINTNSRESAAIPQITSNHFFLKVLR